MRKKELKLVITFESTSDAIGFESHCESNNIDGRLIPVPQIISAGCGMAWCTDCANRSIMEKAAMDADVTAEFYECMV